MNASDEDEFDFDFVNNASKKVQSNWAKDFNREKSESRRSAKRDKAAEEQAGEIGCKKTETLAPCQTSPVKVGKENSLGKSEVMDSPVEITPPGSPTGGTPLSARTVRGANRTNKTKKALAQLKKTTTISARSENVGPRNVVLALSDEEDGAEEACNEAGVSILMSYGENPHYVKLPIFSEFMENSTKFMKNSDLTKWTQNLR